MRILLLPPDERPVSTRLPLMVGACAGAEVLVPPPTVLPSFRNAADFDALADWLGANAGDVDGVVMSLDLAAHGGLVPSRLTDDTLADLLARLDALRRLPLRAGVPVFGAMVVTRVPDVDDATEEPEYWARHGRAIHALSAALSDVPSESVSSAEADAARARVPDGVARDWLRRRLRNHGANLAALELVADGTLDLLALTADDTSPRGLPAAERAWLEAWTARLGFGERVFHYPGADEVPSVLITRMVSNQPRPRVAIHAADRDGLARVAPYEDQPVEETVRAQISAAGAVILDDVEHADVVLAVHPPSDDSGDWALAPPSPDAALAGRTLRLADDIARLIGDGRQVAVADCAWPNGGDPALVDALAERGVLGRLVAYAGWNTAGNTIGTAIAHALAGLAGKGRECAEAREQLLVHRLLEDVGYQTRVRTRLRASAADRLDSAPPVGSEDGRGAAAGAESRLADRLNAELARFGELGTRWRVRPGSVRLPWRRTFECDFELERVDG